MRGPTARRLGGRSVRILLLAGLCLAGTGLTAATAATAATPVAGGPEPTCVPSAARVGDRAGQAPGRTVDGPTYSRRELRRIDRRLERRLESRLESGQPAAAVTPGLELRIPVHVHVIASAREPGPAKGRVRRQIDVLNDAYAGGQSADGTRTPFRFYLATFERVRSNRWQHSAVGSRADLRMRRTLHRGDRGDLNLYVLQPRDPFGHQLVLGWSSAPWQAGRHPRLDGVTVHRGSLPGGGLRGYARGDTAVHEIGHWLGLFHTFEGGFCDGPGDLVDDTPAQSVPSTTCDGEKDTCPAEGLDPVHNFMDYAVDACMDQFTPGQVSRMTDNWLAYRTP